MPRGVRASAFLVGKRLLPPNLFRVSCETLNNDRNSHVRIPGNYPGRHIGKMLHALRQQFWLDVAGPWNIGENLRFCRPGNPILPTDLGLRCPCLITLRHVVLHRVEQSNFGLDVAFACTLLSNITLGSESNKVEACLPAGRAKNSLTGHCRGYSNLFYDGSGLKTTPVGGQQKGGRNRIATLSVFRKRKALGYTTK